MQNKPCKFDTLACRVYVMQALQESRVDFTTEGKSFIFKLSKHE